MHPTHYIAYIALSDPPPKNNKFAPFITGDTSHRSTHWDNGKMKISCDSAYVQTETLNFIFARQTIMVYFYLCSNFQETAMPNAKYECTSRLFLPIILDCTLIASKKSIWPFTYTELLLLLVILVQTYRRSMLSPMNA